MLHENPASDGVRKGRLGTCSGAGVHCRAECMHNAGNATLAAQRLQARTLGATPVRPALRASLVEPPPAGRLLPPHSCVSSCTCRSAAFTSWLIDSVERKGCVEGGGRCGRHVSGMRDSEQHGEGQ